MQILTEVLVIGGGPAGCAAALSAFNSGVKDITIIEKEPHGRHRIGEILLTQTILEMKKLGIDEEIHAYAEKYKWGKKYAAAYVHGKDRKPWRVQNNNPIASQEDQPHIPRCFINKENGLWYTLMVRRHEFDEALREICQKRGIKIIHGNVKDFKILNDDELNEKEKSENINSKLSSIAYVNVETETDNLKIISKFIIDATGQQAFIPRKLKVRHKVDDWDLQARYAYFTDVQFDNAIEAGFYKEGANILSYQDGWVWLACLGQTENGKDITSVGIVSKVWNKEGENFVDKIANLPEYKLFGLDKANYVDCYGKELTKEDSGIYAHPNYRYRSLTMRGSNWACVGDSAMFLDPLLSQGVTLAMSFGNQLGAIAHKIIDGSAGEESLLEYEKSYSSELEVLNKVVSLWYNPDFTFNKDWAGTAKKVSHLFGRQIGNDVEAFRWVSNLENIHHVIKDKNDKEFLKILNDVNTIKMIHDFEKEGLLNL